MTNVGKKRNIFIIVAVIAVIALSAVFAIPNFSRAKYVYNVTVGTDVNITTAPNVTPIEDDSEILAFISFINVTSSRMYTYWKNNLTAARKTLDSEGNNYGQPILAEFQALYPDKNVDEMSFCMLHIRNTSTTGKFYFFYADTGIEDLSAGDTITALKTVFTYTYYKNGTTIDGNTVYFVYDEPAAAQECIITLTTSGTSGSTINVYDVSQYL